MICFSVYFSHVFDSNIIWQLNISVRESLNLVTRIENGQRGGRGSIYTTEMDTILSGVFVIISIHVIVIIIIIIIGARFCGVTEANIYSPGPQPRQCNESLISATFDCDDCNVMHCNNALFASQRKAIRLLCIRMPFCGECTDSYCILPKFSALHFYLHIVMHY